MFVKVHPDIANIVHRERANSIVGAMMRVAGEQFEISDLTENGSYLPRARFELDGDQFAWNMHMLQIKAPPLTAPSRPPAQPPEDIAKLELSTESKGDFLFKGKRIQMKVEPTVL
jgi:hypothetical protein